MSLGSIWHSNCLVIGIVFILLLQGSKAFMKNVMKNCNMKLLLFEGSKMIS